MKGGRGKEEWKRVKKGGGDGQPPLVDRSTDDQQRKEEGEKNIS